MQSRFRSAEETDVPRSAQQNNINAVRGQQSTNSDQASGDDSSNNNGHKGLRRRLAQLHHQQAMEDMMTVLESAGDSGRLFLAQLRSQRTPFAMAWLGHAGLAEMSTVETATMLKQLRAERAALDEQHRLRKVLAAHGRRRADHDHSLDRMDALNRLRTMKGQLSIALDDYLAATPFILRSKAEWLAYALKLRNHLKLPTTLRSTLQLYGFQLQLLKQSLPEFIKRSRRDPSAYDGTAAIPEAIEAREATW
jgi:hypothetical protein